MALFKEKLYSYSGNGTLISEDNTITIPIQFTCSQLFDGTIEGEIQLTAKVSDSLLPFKLRRIGFIIDGQTNEGHRLTVHTVRIRSGGVQWRNNQEPIIEPLKFVALSICLQRRKLKSANSTIMLNYGITYFNSDSFKVWIDTNVGKISFEPIKECDNVLRLIKDYERVCLTSVAQLSVKPEIKHAEAKEYIDATQNELWKILDLTSFGQGIYQGWMYCQVLEKNGNDYEIVYVQHRKPKSKLMKPREVIPSLTIREYLTKVYPKCTDELDSRTELRGAIEWYVEALGADTLEAQYLIGYVCLELLVDKFNKTALRETILEESTFRRFKNRLKGEAHKILCEMGIDCQRRAAIYAGISNLNRYPFVDDLKQFLEEHRIGYSDLYADLTRVAEIRNKIAHEGILHEHWTTLYQDFNNLMVLNQRIILSILQYEGDFINWNNDFKVEGFDRDPSKEYASKSSTLK